jgi:hypothetical protein
MWELDRQSRVGGITRCPRCPRCACTWGPAAWACRVLSFLRVGLSAPTRPRGGWCVRPQVRFDAAVAARHFLEAYCDEDLDQLKPHVAELLNELFKLMDEVGACCLSVCLSGRGGRMLRGWQSRRAGQAGSSTSCMRFVERVTGGVAGMHTMPSFLPSR